LKICYIDTNILISRITPEQNSPELTQQIESVRGRDFAFLTSELTRLEVSRFLHRVKDYNTNSVVFEQQNQNVLAGIQLIRLNSSTLERAASFPFTHLGSLDSIHLASAQIVGATHFLTRDRQLINACAGLGIATTF
jgi:predicted nucleic acid-binding protein